MLYDEILVRPPSISPAVPDGERLVAQVMEMAQQAVRVNANNVSDYLFRVHEREVWDLATDFPRCVPPFPMTWIEWVIPSQSNSEGRVVQLSMSKVRCALLLHCEEIQEMLASRTHLSDDEKCRHVLTVAASLDKKIRDERNRLGNQLPPLSAPERTALLALYDRLDHQMQNIASQGTLPRWRVAAFLLLSLPEVNDGHPSLVPHEIHLLFSQEGELYLLPAKDGKRTGYVSFGFGPQGKDEQGVQPQLLFVPLLTFSFLNCKNVRRVNVQADQKLNKARVRRGKLPLASYYTLEITPMTEVLRQEGKSETLGLAKALHLCRGYFADYTQGKGLFGKYHGHFWVPAHKRGSEKVGVIEKEYQVNAPAKK